jgi:putative protease
MIESNKIELMAPAGSSESLMAAIQAGADSVYFGLDSLNMRNAKGSNFVIDDLPNISKICKENNIKSYLTLNTVVFDNDIKIVREILDAAKANQIDAVIASDHAVMNYARKIGQRIHISTQCNITNIDSVEFYSAYGDVMVMARELSLDQVSDIVNEIKNREITGPSGDLVKIEVFGHGALCMSVSGKCYLSLDNYSASANRGSCVQNCRRKYVVIDKERNIELEIDNEYIMSAKDLCTIEFLDKIINAGVSVLKIEGRGRSADYVYTVASCYREAIDAFSNGEYTSDKFEGWVNRLSTVFNRGFWDGYYLGKKIGEWSDKYGSKATQRKALIGKGVNYFQGAQVAEFLMESLTLEIGEDIIIIGPTTGIIQTKIEELRVNGVQTSSVTKGDRFTISLDKKIRASDKLYKIEYLLGE